MSTLLKYSAPLLLVGLLVVLYLWHVSAQRSSQLAAQRDSLRVAIERIETERDSIDTQLRLRKDSLEARRSREDSLLDVTDALRAELWRIRSETDSLLRPNFETTLDDSSLARRVDSLLRVRIRSADSLR